MSAQKYNPLTKEEAHVILDKGTEAPFSGVYENFNEKGTYVCKQCDSPLYKSTDKFNAGCGWPSFDDAIPGAVKRIPDADGRRTEIVCAKCGAHLGHVFEGERFTDKDTRHCVNSISLNFFKDEDLKTETAVFGGGCFWGMEYYFSKEPGVLSSESGFMGGNVDNPSYREVCTGTTGHAEVIKVTYNPQKVSYENLAKLFFEIHDPCQTDGQGPDIGDQYRSEVFYFNDIQKKIAENLISQLKTKGYKVVTKVTPASSFWKAEDYHQNYYERKGTQPYCHVYTKKFD